MMVLAQILYDPTAPRLASDPDALQPEHAELEQELRSRGAFAGFAGLYPIEMAKRIRERDGARMVIDGPFAETKEALGGVYVLECPDMATALELASPIPVDSRSWIEVRPIGLWHPL